MIRGLLIYLLIGVVIMWILEIFWNDLELGDDESIQLNWNLRIGVFIGWPVLVLGTILGLLNNGNDDTGLGYGT